MSEIDDTLDDLLDDIEREAVNCFIGGQRYEAHLNAAKTAVREILKASEVCVTELEAACRAALDWYGPDGDHISDPVRTQLLRALRKEEK